ncbi:helix-hairpin-helix domain-containing protein [Lentilactobacillus hilgardii]|uniref:ComEA protein n=1 Tax=Lentilactobacillus hilgardii (strain ATCC 8290 / DSM 20176 / CCUG 30140 / JCM 1155 / KCTC 3500 / NBRC 15886 / NCIMB 8040 / NRRL B-1843 / 9) TaxID=1423757 RepID=C0XKQ1_LENH9|nr:helix-hairpin-helix domain-containing protein [Lentilactobacillus hilgardii]EEI24046.1 comEA protein [Lentilactobacillus hilgardii DSM 20176 = ATCC 8290]KRK57945.1 competence protein ComEA [Lentilactobacillus hilgardii DSM 20176 = ATCC 8290]QEU38267.1 ComEA family DNA-binding protein [Lentilactobacillus hilgardii]TDG79077.1 hypothetical protein C5L34_001342 [Lentilactobacillus hilgardii]
MNRIREFIDEYLYQVLISAAVIIIILVVIVFSLVLGHSSKPQVQGMVSTTSVTEASTTSQSKGSDPIDTASSVPQSSSQQLYVDVKGAVKNPGVYQVGANMRVVDAIDLAGGFNRSADKKQVNLAQKLTDQQIVYIPIKGEIKGNRSLGATPSQSPPAETSSTNPQTAATSNAESSSGSPTEGTEKINLNTADKSKLQELNGIGDKKADQIIAYRQAHGQFKSIEELKDVPGFGDKTFDNLKSTICV